MVASAIHQLRLKSGDSEKITINVGYVDLGHIDLMVQEGFYSNRTDFIRTAIRNQLERHADVVKQSTVRKRLDLGLRHYSREDLEAVRGTIGPPIRDWLPFRQAPIAVQSKRVGLAGRFAAGGCDGDLTLNAAPESQACRIERSQSPTARSVCGCHDLQLSQGFHL